MTPDDDETTAPRPQWASAPPAADGRTQRIDRTAMYQPTGVYDRTLTPGAPAPSPDAVGGNELPMGTYLGEFEITSVIGEGGFGIVYLATDHSLQRRVALKEYMPSSLAARAGGTQVQVKSERYRETFEAGRKSFVNEARLLAQFDHASLVKVYRFWEANGTAYMVMPFYEGVTLKDLLRQLGRPPDEAWLKTMLGPLTEALRVLHAEQCYHRDIAPDNVILLGGSHARPLLLDFGAARRVIGDMTQALTVILKPGYAPIEQYAEVPGMKQGAWTDIYALAAVVYFAIVGRTPPPAVGRLLHDNYMPLTKTAAGRYSEPFLRAIDRALAVRAEQRTPTIEQLRQEMGFAPAPGGRHDAGVTDITLSLDDAGAAPGAAFDQPPTMVMPRPGSAPPAAEYAPTMVIPRPAAAAAPQPAAAYEPTMIIPRPAAAEQADRRAAAAAAAAAAAVSPGSGSARGMLVGGAVVVVLAALAFGGWRLMASKPEAPLVVSVPVPNAPAGPAAAATAAAPAVFDPSAEFDRVVQAQTTGFTVRAQAGRPSFRIGRDKLAFTVEAEREGFVTVLAYDSSGLMIQLYPNDRVKSLRVKPGQPLKLPRPENPIDITEPAGNNRLLVMVSTLPRDYAALSPARLEDYRTLPTGADAQRLLAAHSGPLPLLLGRPVCPATGPCTDEYGATVLPIEVVR